jgi:hypothetical protein
VEDRTGRQRVEHAAERATIFYLTTDPLVWIWDTASYQ